MSSQTHGDSAGSSSSSSEYKRAGQGRRGGSNKGHYGRSPQAPATATNDTGTSAQKRIRNLQQKSHEKSADYKLRPQTGRLDHSKGADSSKPPQRNNSGPSKSKGNPHRKGQSHDSDAAADTKSKKLPKENGATSKTISKDMKRYERKDSGIGHSPPSIEPPTELESTDPSIVDLSTGGGVGESEEQVSVAEAKEALLVEPEQEKKQKSDRKQYTREVLLSLSKSPASLKKHPSLNASIDIMFLKSSGPTPSTELEGEGVKKHPTALSLIKEHDARQLPKVSLSPQRKSFHGGCSWNDSKAPDTPSSAKDNSSFEFESTFTPLVKANQGSTQQGPPPVSRHKVIDHVPLRDQELGRGSKKNWREKTKEPEWAKDSHGKGGWEEEPEWMDFGPNDRFELIELKGLEEHEREREARLGREETESQPEEEDSESPLTVELGGEHPENELQPADIRETKTRNPGDNKPHKREVTLKAALEIDNFMLDGFDFSTGLSFCTALDDEEEVRSAQSPAEVGNALMKVLKIGGDEKELPSKDKAETILGVSSRPVNALTLEEIHARENIQTTPTLPTPSVSSSEELGAFNKLVAGLQSSGALHKESSEAGTSTVKPSSNQSSTISPVPMSSASGPNVSVPFRSENSQPPQQNTFGSALEKEMEFDDEVITGSHPHYQRPPPEIPSQYSSRVSRVEHLERMLEKLDQEQGMRDKQKPLPPELSPHTAGGYSEQHMKPKLPQSHSSRMTRGAPIDGQRPMPMMERDYVYHEGEHRVDMLPLPNIGIRPQGGMNRSNHWAVEMERRRLVELKQMERARMERAMYSNSMHGGGGMPHKMREVPPPKPNISLLPTAVMRQMHNSKQNQSLSDVPKSNSVDPRAEQEFNMKGSHTPISNVYGDMEHPSPRLHPSQMYSMGPGGGGGAQMRSVPPFRPVSDPAAASMMYRGYYNMPVMPHGGMQNPYMY